MTYRLLNPGEVTQEGDESYNCVHSRWFPSRIGVVVMEISWPVRRPIPPPSDVVRKIAKEVSRACDLPGAIAAALQAERDRADKLAAALIKINAIRNSIVGCQSFNFSEHAFPLVAALNEAGIEGMPYPEAKVNVGTLIERANAAEACAEKSEALLAEAVKALEPFAAQGRQIDQFRDPMRDGYFIGGYNDDFITAGHCRAANAALSRVKGGEK